MNKILKGTLAMFAIAFVVFGLSGCVSDKKLAEKQAELDAANQAKEQALANKQADIDNAVSQAKQGTFTQAEVDAKVAEANKVKEETKTEEGSSTESVSLKTEWSDEYYLGIPLSLEIGDSKVSKLSDSEIEFDDENYDVAEYIVVNSEAEISSSQESKYKDFKLNPYLVLDARGAVRYDYVFDEGIPVDDIDEDNELSINFLEEDIKIVQADENSVTFFTAPETFMSPGESVVIDGKTIKLLNIGTNAVVLEVDGVVETIRESTTEKVNGVDISVSDIFYDDTKADRVVMIKAGKEAKKEVDDGEALIAFGQDKDEPEWVLDIVVTDGELKKLSAVYDQRRNDLDDDYKPLAIGESLVLPNDFAKLSFVKISKPDYFEYEISKDSTYDFELRSVKSEGLSCGGKEYSRVWVKTSTEEFYDSQDVLIACTSLELDDSEFAITGGLELKKGSGIYLDLLNLVPIGYDREEDIMDNYGVKLYDTESWNDDRDDFRFSVPEEQLEATIGIQ